MKHFLILIFLLISTLSIAQQSTVLDFIKSLKGKDPVVENVHQNAELQTRLKKIMKPNDYKYFMNAWNYGEPIQIKGDYGYINVVGQNRAAGQAELFIDFKNNQIYAVIGSIYVENPSFVFSETKAKKIPANISKLFSPY
jgi:hypothetical protein